MNVLIAVDVQTDFIDGSLAVPDALQIIRPLMAAVHAADFVIATADWHPFNHSSFITNNGAWPEHCVAGTRGAQLHPLVETNAHLILHKGMGAGNGYSGFDNPALERIFDSFDPADLHVTVAGLATDYCVKATALDASLRGYDTTVLLAASRGVDPETTEQAVNDLIDGSVIVVGA